MELEFKGIPPSKKNSKRVFCRGGRPTVIPSEAYVKWHEKTTEELGEVTPLEKKMYVCLYYFYIPLNKDGSENKRPFDYTNKIESIQDFLVDIGAIEDDNYNFMMPRVMHMEFVPYGEGRIILETKDI